MPISMLDYLKARKKFKFFNVGYKGYIEAIESGLKFGLKKVKYHLVLCKTVNYTALSNTCHQHQHGSHLGTEILLKKK